MSSTIILLLILVVAILGKANSMVIAICGLLILKLLGLERIVYPYIEKNGMTWGLILIIAAIMIPIANGSVSAGSIKNVFTSWIGLTALVISFFTTYLSGQGLNFLQGHSEVMPALIIGAVAAAAFLGGVPVGPLITSGILALFVKMIHK